MPRRYLCDELEEWEAWNKLEAGDVEAWREWDWSRKQKAADEKESRERFDHAFDMDKITRAGTRWRQEREKTGIEAGELARAVLALLADDERNRSAGKAVAAVPVPGASKSRAGKPSRASMLEILGALELPPAQLLEIARHTGARKFMDTARAYLRAVDWSRQALCEWVVADEWEIDTSGSDLIEESAEALRGAKFPLSAAEALRLIGTPGRTAREKRETFATIWREKWAAPRRGWYESESDWLKKTVEDPLAWFMEDGVASLKYALQLRTMVRVWDAERKKAACAKGGGETAKAKRKRTA